MPDSIIGRPEMMTTISLSTIGLTLSMTARSPAGSCRVAESPTPSAYGRSATTTMPTAAWVPALKSPVAL